MDRTASALFLLGSDYHLGDLLWLTAVIAEYRRQRKLASVAIGLPDRDISRILEHCPVVDRLLYGEPSEIQRRAAIEMPGPYVIHDLRMIPLARVMIQDWRHHLPWLYYRDLWLQPRGQWLATFLHLEPMRDFRPILKLTDSDYREAGIIRQPFVALAPHIGSYSLPLASRFWRRVKGWDDEKWPALAARFRAAGYETITLSASGQRPVPGTVAVAGLPIRQVAGIIGQADALVSGESGLWFIAAALGTPFVIVPWWLPRSADWTGPMRTPHRLVRRDQASVENVYSQFVELIDSVRVG